MKANPQSGRKTVQRKIESILNFEKRNDKIYYLVKWQGYKEKYNTWEKKSKLVELDE